jgi:hypothetical protein
MGNLPSSALAPIFEDVFLAPKVNIQKFSLEDLAKKAQKVLFSIKSRVASLGNIPIKVSNNLFDKLVQPVLTYNAEISFMDSYLTYYRAKHRAEITNKEIDNFTFIDKIEEKKILDPSACGHSHNCSSCYCIFFM